MRTTINHVPPKEMQPMPADNTSKYCESQIKICFDSDETVHTQVAMEIAAWYQSPQNIALAKFASTGTLSMDLMYEISQEMNQVVDLYRYKALGALLDYVKAAYKESLG